MILDPLLTQIKKKGIPQETLDNLNGSKVYLCSDVVFFLNELHQLTCRFNYRSQISENDHKISSIGTVNLSSHHYDNEEERQSLLSRLRISELAHEVKKTTRTPTSRKSKPSKKSDVPIFLPPTELVTIDHLKPWDNNQSFIGKIISLRQVTSGKNEAIYLKGQVADGTGVVNYDLAQKRTGGFALGDTVLFEKVMNKGKPEEEGKEPRHYIEVKKYGSYQVLTDNRVITHVNKDNNLSTKELPPRPDRAEKKEGTKDHEQIPKAHRVQVVHPEQLVHVNQLVIGNNHQSVIAKVLEVREEEIANPSDGSIRTHLIGVMADHTGAVDFDLVKKNNDSVQVGNVVRLDLVKNAFDKSKNKHVVKIITDGKYMVLSDHQIHDQDVNQTLIVVHPRPQKKSAPKKPSQSKTEKGHEESKPAENKKYHNTPNGEDRASRPAGRQQGQGRQFNGTKSEGRVYNRHNNNNENNNEGTQEGHYNKQRNENRPRQNRNNENNNNEYNQDGHRQTGSTKQRFNKNNEHHNVESQNENTQEGQRQTRPYKQRFNKNNENQENHNENTQEGQRQQRTNKGGYNRNQEHSNENNQENPRQRQKPRSESYKNSRPRNDDPDFRPQGYCQISSLTPSHQGQTIIGKIFEFIEYLKDIKGRKVTFVSGRIGDETANIKFDFQLREDPILLNKTYRFKKIMNKVDEAGFHFVTIGKFGAYHPEHKVQVGTINNRDKEPNDLSSIEYEKRQVTENK